MRYARTSIGFAVRRRPPGPTTITAIGLKVVKLGGLLEATEAALRGGETERTKKYLDWAVYCRSDSAGPYERLGDYYAKLGQFAEARANYELALRKDQARTSARQKPDRLRK